MFFLRNTDSSDPDFIQLVRELDADLARRDGDEHGFYARFNSIQHLPFVIVACEEQVPVACGAIKTFDDTTMEVKRMYTLPAYRGRNFAGKVLQALEERARELGMKRMVLETGKRQPEAIRLYLKNGYAVIPNYGQYAGVDNSVCFEKIL